MNDFSTYFLWGWEHIISLDAVDHILFIMALAVVFRLAEWRKVLVLVTAFTIGHFITLWLAVLDLIRFSPAWVEFLIPLTIVITAIVNLFNISATLSNRLHYVLALGFGLIHGMGYANAIRFSLMEEQSLGWSLLAFNLGLEIGQLFVVLLILLAGGLVSRFTKISMRLWVMVISLIILLLSLNMVVDRIPKI
ncbi:MAG TPA: HupE/UreJ family protein [Chitinophagaceae bacterium]|nr:HupE/UreJ family protein [Chitinophagaceae bacterium]